ncbi:hypothetical protein ACFQYP_22450 [Nonomuraea antimicrobica]
MIRSSLVVLAALLPALLTGPAAQAAACEAPAVERFGPASLTGAIVGAAVHDGHAYVVTGG